MKHENIVLLAVTFHIMSIATPTRKIDSTHSATARKLMMDILIFLNR